MRVLYASPTMPATCSATRSVRVASNESTSISSFGPGPSSREVVDVPEVDVAHRGPFGYGDREGEEGDAALRIQAPVDRVEDDAGPVRAEGALAQLLGDERELGPGRMQIFEESDDRGLGGRVDRRRLVAALALTRDRLSFQPRRELRERSLDRGRRVAAEGEPIAHSSKGEKRSPLASLG